MEQKKYSKHFTVGDLQDFLKDIPKDTPVRIYDGDEEYAVDEFTAYYEDENEQFKECDDGITRYVREVHVRLQA